ncbi:hypothetical protein [Cribrihabitans pelagius]|uniref:hypothetical protein n=1 Tax=Cribrihabitans pelagius TaxID=1765746 RepID=UPI003B594DC3
MLRGINERLNDQIIARCGLDLSRQIALEFRRVLRRLRNRRGVKDSPALPGAGSQETQRQQGEAQAQPF